MTPTFLFGTFFGFVLAYLMRLVLGSIGIHKVRSQGFCARCGRRAPAVLGYAIDLETGDRESAVFCAPCYSHQSQVIQAVPPPWSK